MNYSPHPYYPLDSKIDGYVANKYPVPTLLTAASTGSFLILGTIYILVSYVRSNLSKADRLAILWFFLCMPLRFDIQSFGRAVVDSNTKG